ncbi:phosphotransferase [Thioalkalivibrio sp. ARh3]|uniref:phosphotransferase n=1 Tax=Thioalkalivibrio sp. ARh3 TaxID=1158148 RepID=UPI000379FD1C|nr:phosphotransferase [Thioalkalivibrio sp. ARh3]
MLDILSRNADAGSTSIIRHTAQVIDKGNSRAGVLRRCVAYDDLGQETSWLIEKHHFVHKGHLSDNDEATKPFVEAQVYEAVSGWGSLRNFRAPEFMGKQVTPYGWRLWLEDLEKSGCKKVGTPTDLETAHKIARAVGVFSGNYWLNGDLADLPDLSRKGRLPGMLRPKRSQEFIAEATTDLTRGQVDGRGFAEMVLELGSWSEWLYRRSSDEGAVAVCHGDVHGGNFMVAPDGQLVLLDFEKVCLGPVGLDMGRFLGEPAMRAARTSTRGKRDIEQFLEEWRAGVKLEYQHGLEESGVVHDREIASFNVDYFFVLRVAVLICERERGGDRRKLHRNSDGIGFLVSYVWDLGDKLINEMGRR